MILQVWLATTQCVSHDLFKNWDEDDLPFVLLVCFPAFLRDACNMRHLPSYLWCLNNHVFSQMIRALQFHQELFQHTQVDPTVQKMWIHQDSLSSPRSVALYCCLSLLTKINIKYLALRFYEDYSQESEYLSLYLNLYWAAFFIQQWIHIFSELPFSISMFAEPPSIHPLWLLLILLLSWKFVLLISTSSVKAILLVPCFFPCLCF